MDASMKYCYELKDISRVSKAKNLSFGGKADALSILLNNRIRVPQGYAIATEAFNGKYIIESAKEDIKSCIEQLSISKTYAVRSSAVGEDGLNTSFAGAYETILDVSVCEIYEAIYNVLSSAENERVQIYTQNQKTSVGKMGIIIQEFIPADYAGVLFTKDFIHHSSAQMIGNYVQGIADALVSGNVDAKQFSYQLMEKRFHGDLAFERLATKIVKKAIKIKKMFGIHQDIEWAVKDQKVYILQSRPITTLYRRNLEEYEVNDSLEENCLLSKTNVGEIFMKPLSPMTDSVLQGVFQVMGFPLIVNVCGQPYANISSVCSVLVSFGVNRQTAYKWIADVAGKIPEHVEIPIYPFDKGQLIHKMLHLVFQKRKKGFVSNIAVMADDYIEKIRIIHKPDELYAFWETTCDPFMTDVLGSIVKGLSIKSLFSTREKLIQIAGEDLANQLCSNCSLNGTLESLNILLALEEVIKGTMTRAEYLRRYGHRHANEMELSEPYPYEDDGFMDNALRQYKESGMSAYEFKKNQENNFFMAYEEFSVKYPNKVKWLDRLLQEFSYATYQREDIRSQSVKLFCLMREFLLQASELLMISKQDIFMLYFQEVMDLLVNKVDHRSKIASRKKNYDVYLEMPGFPNIIKGPFDPLEFCARSNKRWDYYCFEEEGSDSLKEDSKHLIKGISGGSGVVEGVARVVSGIREMNEFLEGEILVTNAINVGWIQFFTKASAIVTDIGAPLSHAAIVARELGVLAVVGCQNATTNIKTGDFLLVDGKTGTIHIQNDV